MRFIRKRKRKIEKREYQVTVNIPQYDNYNNHPEFSSPSRREDYSSYGNLRDGVVTVPLFLPRKNEIVGYAIRFISWHTRIRVAVTLETSYNLLICSIMNESPRVAKYINYAGG